MAQGKIIKALKFLEEKLIESGLRVSKVLLFGSQNKNIATAQSDIDVLIVSNDFEKKNIFQRAILTKQAEIQTIRKFKLPLDILTLTEKEANKKSLLLKF